MIEGYRIYPGEHCGSASMRSLLEHYCDLRLPEPVVFGLGAGLECMVIRGDGMDPPRNIFGRTGTLEVDTATHLGIDYREKIETDDAQAWQIARDEVLAGRPTMLTGDILYLDYREYKVHFPAHRFVMLGFDDDSQKAFIADRIRDVPEACSYGALIKSRNPPDGLSTRNLWGRFHGTEVRHSLEEATKLALAACATRMIGDGTRRESGDEFGSALAEQNQVSTGVKAIRELGDELESWADLPNATWIASFNGRCIEKFGNGGGNFRRLYAGFLEWARERVPDLVPENAPELAWQAADAWTGIAVQLMAASDEGADRTPWAQAQVLARNAADLEDELFSRIADRVQ